MIESSRLHITKKVCKEHKVNKTLKSNNVYFIEGGGGQRLSVASMVEKGSKRVARLTGGVVDGTRTGFKARPVTKDTIAYLVFSSGTSGPPKGKFPEFVILTELTRTPRSCYDLSWQSHFLPDAA